MRLKLVLQSMSKFTSMLSPARFIYGRIVEHSPEWGENAWVFDRHCKELVLVPTWNAVGSKGNPLVKNHEQKNGMLNWLVKVLRESGQTVDTAHVAFKDKINFEHFGRASMAWAPIMVSWILNICVSEQKDGPQLANVAKRFENLLCSKVNPRGRSCDDEREVRTTLNMIVVSVLAAIGSRVLEHIGSTVSGNDFL
jgi:hypothetical protein